jgi:hypothetical protein
MKRCFAVLAICALPIAMFVPSAGADPTHAKNSLTLNAVCNGTPYQVVTNGNGEFTPAHVIGSTQTFVPYAFDLTFTFTPPGGPTQTNPDTSAKGGPHKGAMTCTIPFQSFSGPQGTFTIAGSVTGFLTPRSH